MCGGVFAKPCIKSIYTNEAHWRNRSMLGCVFFRVHTSEASVFVCVICVCVCLGVYFNRHILASLACVYFNSHILASLVSLCVYCNRHLFVSFVMCVPVCISTDTHSLPSYVCLSDTPTSDHSLLCVFIGVFLC